MNKIKLGKRLELIASLVNYKRVCDVGCDHGKLAYYLLSNKIADYVVVSDISQPSLNKAIDLLSKTDYNFDYICCDGLKGYNNYNIQQCIISGMGGDEIIKIVSNSPIVIKSFILSPQHNNLEVKKYMLSVGYDIDYDIIIKDKGKFYNIIRFEKSDNVSVYSDEQLLIGKSNNNSISDFDEFVDYELNKISKLLESNEIKNTKLLEYYNNLKSYKKRK